MFKMFLTKFESDNRHLKSILIHCHSCPVTDTSSPCDKDIPPRISQDSAKMNKYGKELSNLCKSANLIICNGRFGPEKGIGKFTRFTPRGRNVVDYLIFLSIMSSLYILL